MDGPRQTLFLVAGFSGLTLLTAGTANHLLVEARLAREAKAAAEAAALAAPPPPPAVAPPATAIAPAPDAPETAGARDVTPADMAAPATPAETAALERLPPLLPEAEPAKTDETGREVRLRLLARPIATDTATLRVGRGTITLPGVAPFPASQRCTDPATGRFWPCGRRALTEMRAYLRGRAIRCEAPDGFGTAEETVTSACTLGSDEDIGAWAVRNGWAAAAPDGPYVEAEAKARAEKLGAWR